MQQVLLASYAGSAPITPIAPIISAKVVSGAGNATTPAVDTTGSTILIAAVAWYSGGGSLSGVSDSKGNLWTPLVPQASGAGGANTSVQLWYAAHPTVGTGHTFTISGSNLYASLVVEGFDNVIASTPFDQQNGNHSASETTQQPGSITPSYDNELIVSTLGWIDAAQGIPTIDSGFTIADYTTDASSSAVALAYSVQTTATATNPTWTKSGAAGVINTSIASFRHAASPLGPVTPYNRMLIIGNSFTIIPTPNNTTWWGTWGMAASTQATDFAHVLTDLMTGNSPSLVVDPQSAVTWEVNHNNSFNYSYFDAMLAANPDLIIIRLGENVVDLTNYTADFETLINYCKAACPTARIIVTGNYWTSTTKDSDQQAAALATGVEYVSLVGLDIADNNSYIGATVSGDDMMNHTVNDAGVAIHARDSGMEQIATILYEYIYPHTETVLRKIDVGRTVGGVVNGWEQDGGTGGSLATATETWNSGGCIYRANDTVYNSARYETTSTGFTETFSDLIPGNAYNVYVQSGWYGTNYSFEIKRDTTTGVLLGAMSRTTPADDDVILELKITTVADGSGNITLCFQQTSTFSLVNALVLTQ